MTVPGTSQANRGLPRVLIADGNQAHVDWLAAALGGQCELYKVQNGGRAVALLRGLAPHILIIGSRLFDVEGVKLLEQLRTQGLLSQVVTMFMADPRAGQPPDDDELYYVLTSDMSVDDVQAIVGSAVVRRVGGETQQSPAEAARMRRLLEVPRRYAAQRDLKGASRIATAAIAEFLDADRADCLYYDHDDGTLWSEGDDEDKYQGGREVSARLGIAGFAARTGHPVMVAQADSDPRFNAEVDNPYGSPQDRLIIQPIEASDGQIHAVLVAIREPYKPAFSTEDQRLLGWLSAQLGPLTGQLAMQIEAETVIEEAREEAAGIFRAEAVAARQSAGKRGDVVRVSPNWIGWSFWLLVALIVGGGTFSAIAQIPEYSYGQAVIKQSGRVAVSAPVTGNLVSLHVAAGDTVKAGDLLAVFYSPNEAALLRQRESELWARQRAYLANKSNSAAREAVLPLKSEVDKLERRLRLKATSDGKVNEIRVIEGQQVVEGQRVMSVTRRGGRLEVIALMPGGDKPRLRRGQQLILKLNGYRYATQQLEIGSVTTDLLGPADAMQLLGADLKDTVRIGGAVVVVRAELPGPTFEADNETFEYSHGMLGTAEVRLREESVLKTLIPGLRD